MWDNEVLIIPRKTSQAMVKTARQFNVVEVCGVLIGWGTVGEIWWPISNIHPEPEKHYQMDPDQQVRAWEWADKRSLKVVAVVHTHPNRDASLSSADIDYAAFGPDTFYAVLGMDPLELRAWTIEPDGDGEKKVTSHGVHIDPSKYGLDYCWSHNRYEDTIRAFRRCFECGHVFVQEMDLITAHNDEITEMVKTSDDEETKRDLSANRIDSADQLDYCPYCSHSW